MKSTFPRFSWSGTISYIPFKKDSEMKRLLRFAGSMVGFPTKIIQKRVKYEKVALIAWRGSRTFIQKQFNNWSKLKTLLRFAWSSRISYKTIQKRVKFEKVNYLRFAWSTRISYKNHSKTTENWNVCFDLRGLVGFHTKAFKNKSNLKRLLRFG